MSIQNKTLDTVAANILVGSGTIGTATTTIYFCNRTGAATTFNLYVVPAGFTANANNIVYSNKVVASNDTYIADIEKIYLGNGDMLVANANVANSIVATVSSIGI
jgi:hypothetical protein